MNPHHRRRKHFEESSPSSDLLSSGSEGEGYAETKSASIRRDTDVRESARTLMSRSADTTRHGASVSKDRDVGTSTGRPLARHRRAPISRPSDKSPAGTITTRARDRSLPSRDHISPVSPSNRRHPSRHTPPSRLHRSSPSSDRDVAPRVDLKRSRGTSTIPGAGAGGTSTTGNLSSILSSPQRASNRIGDSQARPAQSVRFSRIRDKKTSKSNVPETRVPSRAAVPTSTKSFIPAVERSSDESSSTSSSSTSELETKKKRTRMERGAKRTSKPMSRARIPERSRHSNTRQASRKRSSRHNIASSGSKRKVTHHVQQRSARRKLSVSDESSSSGSESSTSSTSDRSSSLEDSEDDGALPAVKMTRMRSPEKQQRTTAAQTEEMATPRPVSISRASQTNLLKPAKRVVSRMAAPGSPGTSPATAASPSAQLVKTPSQRTRGSTATDASAKVSPTTSSAGTSQHHHQRDTTTTSATPLMERVSSAEPSTNVFENEKGVAALPSGSPMFAGRRRFAEKVADILARLLPEEQVFVDSMRAAALPDQTEAVSETPSTTAFVRASSTTRLEGSSDVVRGDPEEYLGHSDTATPMVDGIAGHTEQPSGIEVGKLDERGSAEIPQLKSSLTDEAQRTPGGDTGPHAGFETKSEPVTTVVTELEPSSSYLGLGVVIPPSMPSDDSIRMRSPTPPTENVKSHITESKPRIPPEWSVAAEPRLEAPPESPIPVVTRTRLWQPWILCSAAAAMILLPLAFVLVPLISSAAISARRQAAPRSSRDVTVLDGQGDTVVKQEVYVEDADFPISCGGSASKQSDNVSAFAVSGAYSVPYKGDPDPKPQFRPLLCVFETEFFHPKRPYTPLHIATPFCTTVIFYSVSLNRFNGAVNGGFRRPLDEQLFNNISASRLQGALRHRSREIPFYVTFGGLRSDSADYVRMLQDATWRKAMVDGIVNDTTSERSKYDGVNLDWNHPGDECDVLKQPQLFHVLVESLSAKRVKVMLTVPPLPRYVALYDLDPLLESVERVVLTTHKLRSRPLSVDCSGGRLYAAPAFREIRDAHSAAYRKKFAYSVSAGGDTFVTRSVALGAVALTSPAPPPGLILRPNKTSFESVCNVKPVIANHTDRECVVAIMQIEKSVDAGILYYVAAYAGPKQLQERMHRAYDDDMGDAPVAVFDAFLDDFAGLCPGDSPRMSPQLAAIAESTRRELQ